MGLIWPDNANHVGFRTAASLHSHTSCSQEPLSFLTRFRETSKPGGWLVNQLQSALTYTFGRRIDIDRLFWTPPLTPRAAWRLEFDTIRARFENALVSITDHDDITAPLALRAAGVCDAPVSVEWTVPWGATFFHIGVHNFSGRRATETMEELTAYTGSSEPVKLHEILKALTAEPDVLIVFNHPLWDENGIGQDQHSSLRPNLCGHFERLSTRSNLMVLRPVAENKKAELFAREHELPLISGGDRHGIEPNTVLNVTNAKTFAEFAAEIRDGVSTVLVTNRYCCPFGLRILQNTLEILGSYDSHELGWRNWTQRVFYKCDDGVTCSLATLLPEGSYSGLRTVTRTLSGLPYNS